MNIHRKEKIVHSKLTRWRLVEKPNQQSATKTVVYQKRRNLLSILVGAGNRSEKPSPMCALSPPVRERVLCSPPSSCHPVCSLYPQGSLSQMCKSTQILDDLRQEADVFFHRHPLVFQGWNRICT